MAWDSTLFFYQKVLKISVNGKKKMHHAIQIALDNLSETLKSQNLWETLPPPDDAFKSTAPFAIDYLNAHQWLQWIFIPQMHDLLAQNAPLPAKIAISPYLEEVFKEEPFLADLLIPIIEIERLLQQEQR